VPLGVESLDSELGVDVAGFLGLKKPWMFSASCVKTSFLVVVVLVEVSGVTLLPSSVTVPIVGLDLDRVDAGGWVVVVPGPDGSCPCVVAVVRAGAGLLFTSDSCESSGSDLALIDGEFVVDNGEGIEPGIDSTPVTRLVTPCPIAPGTPV
jgi:hypothetical protein